jgi:hypothetical protein
MSENEKIQEMVAVSNGVIVPVAGPDADLLIPIVEFKDGQPVVTGEAMLIPTMVPAPADTVVTVDPAYSPTGVAEIAVEKRPSMGEQAKRDIEAVEDAKMIDDMSAKLDEEFKAAVGANPAKDVERIVDLSMDLTPSPAEEKVAQPGVTSQETLHGRTHTVVEFHLPNYTLLLKAVGDTVKALNFTVPAMADDKFICESVLEEQALLTDRGRLIISVRIQRKKLDNGKLGRRFVTMMVGLPSRPPIWLNPMTADAVASRLQDLSGLGIEAESRLKAEDEMRRDDDKKAWEEGLSGKGKEARGVKHTGKTERDKAKGKTSAQRKVERSAKDQAIRNQMRSGKGGK